MGVMKIIWDRQPGGDFTATINGIEWRLTYNQSAQRWWILMGQLIYKQANRLENAKRYCENFTGGK